jgi:formamidopyrimidine-DNA glycosylase
VPELPEVQALADDLRRRLDGKTIEKLVVAFFPALKTFDPPVEALTGTTVTDVTRHGKFLDVEMHGDDGELHLVFHLARSGWLRWHDRMPAPTGRPGRGPVAARLLLTDGSGFTITEASTKKSLSISVVRHPGDVQRIATLGPDPLDDGFTEAAFAAILGGSGRAQIKGVLRDQSVIAGIGNAYSDEILHAAKMSPFKPASMSADEISRLYRAMRTTLRDAVVRADGVAAADLKGEKKSNLQVHGRTGEPCPVCGDVIRQVRFADSSLQYCPTCQTGGKPLADRAMSRLLK